MKYFKKITPIIILATSMFWSCETDGLMLFDSAPDVYFANYTSHDDLRDIHVKFFDIAGNDDTVKIRVRVTGALDFHNDRYVDFDYVRDFTEAVEGVHFELIKPAVIPAGKDTGFVLVRAIRAPDLSDNDQALRLQIRLLPNNYFRTEFKTAYSPTTGRTMDMIHQSIFISDALVQPQHWYEYYFGTFSLKKLLMICDVNRITPAFMDGQPDANGNVWLHPIWTIEVARAGRVFLEEEHNAGRTIYEDYEDESGNRVRMTMGPGA
jgi:hypothetical protein